MILQETFFLKYFHMTLGQPRSRIKDIQKVLYNFLFLTLERQYVKVLNRIHL